MQLGRVFGQTTIANLAEREGDPEPVKRIPDLGADLAFQLLQQVGAPAFFSPAASMFAACSVAHGKNPLHIFILVFLTFSGTRIA